MGYFLSEIANFKEEAPDHKYFVQDGDGQTKYFKNEPGIWIDQDEYFWIRNDEQPVRGKGYMKRADDWDTPIINPDYEEKESFNSNLGDFNVFDKSDVFKYILERLWNQTKEYNDRKSKFADLIINFFDMPNSYKFIIHARVFKNEFNELLKLINEHEERRGFNAYDYFENEPIDKEMLEFLKKI